MNLELKNSLLSALRSGGTHENVLGILRAHRNELTEPDGAYKVLEEIWLELGYDDSDEESQLRDELEFAMERAWYVGVDAGAPQPRVVERGGS